MTRMIVIIALTLFVSGARAVAQEEKGNGSTPASDVVRPYTLSLASAYNSDLGRQESSRYSEETEDVDAGEKSHDYLGISDFFNVREANVNTTQGEWEVELEGEWVTGAGGGDDDFTFTPNIKYGLTDDLFIELEVLPLNLGDGGDQGNGDLALQLFYQVARETDTLPAFAVWVEGRFPSGEGSSGVDGELHLNVTKTLATNLRGHVEGFFVTANGGRGDEDENRRAFQWGTGVGVDYQINDQTICTLNYLNRVSNERGQSNQNILEIGGVREIAEHQHLKLAIDIGLDGHDDTPDFGAKVLWSIEW